MKCTECDKERVCAYWNRLKNFVHSAEDGAYTGAYGFLSLAQLVTHNGKWESFKAWYESFADFCPHYTFNEEEEE